MIKDYVKTIGVDIDKFNEQDFFKRKNNMILIVKYFNGDLKDIPFDKPVKN